MHGHPLIYQLLRWMIESDIQSTWEQLYYLATLLFMSEPGDFLILHFITSLYAMETIALQMPSSMQRDFIKNYWVGSLCILFSRAYFPEKELLQQLNTKYEATIDTDKDTSNKVWDAIIAKAITEEEEHNPKMVYVLQKL